uniref:Uncharacterized protein n=1 Tax=Ditylenchus dipsaci TaxID=166011 RepID=A0A915DZA0_9BILA
MLKKVAKSGAAKRSKAEQAEHKHAHPEGDTRKIVANAIRGEEKRKEQNQLKTEKSLEKKESSGNSK